MLFFDVDLSEASIFIHAFPEPKIFISHVK